MKKFAVALALASATLAGCSRNQALEVSTGSDVTLQKKDGVTVAGRLVEVKTDQVVVETRNGEKLSVARADIASLRADVKSAEGAEAAPAPGASAVGSTGTAPTEPGQSPKAPSNPVARVFNRAPEYREVTIPTGTVLTIDLQTALASDKNNVEDPVRGTLRRGIRVDGVEALPAGTAALGHVTSVERAGRVKGRASIAFRFTRLDPPGEAERVKVQTPVISRIAPATKKKDAAKIGGGAAGGAIIGGIIGGGDGAAKGAAIGGAAGTGVVLSTRGEEVRIGRGTAVTVRTQAPVTVRVLVKK